MATLKPYLEHSGYLSVGADVKALPLNPNPIPDPTPDPNPNPNPTPNPHPYPNPTAHPHPNPHPNPNPTRNPHPSNPHPNQALLICLMERLSQWAPPEDEPEEDNVFALLSAQVTQLSPLVTTPSHHP